MVISREKIQIILANRLMTINELARVSGLSRTYLSALINGKKSNIKPITLGKLAKALDVNVEILLTEE